MNVARMLMAERKRGGECVVMIYTIRILEILVMLTLWKELPTHKDGTVEVMG